MLDRKSKIEDLVGDFRALHQKMAKMGQDLSAKLQITFTEMIVLRIVEDHEGIGIKELAGILGITSSAATQQVDGLVRKGYLVRTAGERDRRSLQISLSPEMTKKINVLKRQGIVRLNSVFAALDDEEFLSYCALSKKIANQVLEK
jgi:DNA-binding MarR family transcriptional regulator